MEKPLHDQNGVIGVGGNKTTSSIFDIIHILLIKYINIWVIEFNVIVVTSSKNICKKIQVYMNSVLRIMYIFIHIKH